MKKTLATLAVAALAANAAGADIDTLGLDIGAYSWQQQYEGQIRAGGSTDIDIETDLGIDDETNNVYYLRLEHPIPILPNVLIQHTELDISAQTTTDSFILFDDVLFPPDTVINTASDLTHTDATLYYQVLDNTVGLDLGITARVFSDGIIIDSPTIGERGELELDATIPLLYAAVKFDLPIKGLYVNADINGLSYDDYGLLDYRLNLGYQFAFGLGVEAGYRTIDIDYEDDEDDEKADVTIEGAYAGLYFHF